MKTVAESLADKVGVLKRDLETLLGPHAEVYHEPTREEGVREEMTPWGPRRKVDFLFVGYSTWSQLSPEGVRIQASVRKQYLHFKRIAAVLIQDQPAGVLSTFDNCHKLVISTVDQQGSPPWATAKDVLREVKKALDVQLSLVTNLYDPSGGNVVYVPDTNALLFNPQLEDWDFQKVPRFTIVLLPTVLAELDELKIKGNDSVRKKSEGIISRIKGYRLRGSITEGVWLRRDKSTLVAMAVEPNLTASLPWLDANQNDDRILASVIEVAREFVYSPVVILTRDINLQNKAEYAGVPFAEPPAPAIPSGV